jgi:predicted  nucleic acid-binding Zn-ribbon protein
MTAETESLILDILKNIQGRMPRIEADLGGLKLRMSAMEGHMGHLETQVAGTNRRIDRLEERIGRIERRLVLTDA